MQYQTIHISQEEKEGLLEKFLKTPEVVPLVSDPKFFSLLVSLGIHQEIGTIHDEFSVFLFNENTGEKIDRSKLRSEIIKFRNHFGVRIWAEGVESLDPRVPGLRNLLHPELSYDSQNRIYQCVYFPEVITKIAAHQGAELVSVRPWGINTIFGGFNPARSYYEGNMWEFINLDAVRYADLLSKQQLVFWGTHDLVSHVAGIQREAWPELKARGSAAKDLFQRYFDGVRNPVPYALVLPYALGMLLDDLAQPMNYQSKSRIHIVSLLMNALESKRINPKARAYLLKYPPSIEELIGLARSNDIDLALSNGTHVLGKVIGEIERFAVTQNSVILN